MKVVPVVRTVAAIAAAATLAACTSATSPVPRSPTTDPVATASPTPGSHQGNLLPPPVQSPATPRTHGGPAEPRPTRRVVHQAVFRARRIYVLIGPAGNARGRVQLRVSRLRSRRFVTASPRLPADFSPDSLFVLDAGHVWFTAFYDGGGRERLYRTADAGTTWHWTLVSPHSFAAGSTDALCFTDPDHGWITTIQPTAPDAMLYATTDGGRDWRLVAGYLRGHPHAGLPTLGPVQYQSDRTTAWDATPAYGPPSSLYVTRDGGATWHAAHTERHGSVARPAVFGRTVVDPVSSCAGHTIRVRLLVSSDDGHHWNREPAVAMGAVPTARFGGLGCRPVAAAEPNADVVWVAALTRGHHLVVKTTCDHGRHWRTTRPPDLRADSEPEISAADCRHALLTVSDRHRIEHLYVTGDAGNTWTLLDRAATN